MLSCAWGSQNRLYLSASDILVFPSFYSSSPEKVDSAVDASLGRGAGGGFTSCLLIKPNRIKKLFVVKSTIFFSLIWLLLDD